MRWSRVSVDNAIRRIAWVAWMVYVNSKVANALEHTVPFVGYPVPHTDCLSAITVVTEGMRYSTSIQFVRGLNHSVPNRQDAVLVYSTIKPSLGDYTRDAMDIAWVFCSVYDADSHTCLAPLFTPHNHLLDLAPFNPRFCKSQGTPDRTHIFTLYDCDQEVVDVLHIRFGISVSRYCAAYNDAYDSMHDKTLAALETFLVGTAVLILILVGIKQYFCRHLDFNIQ